MGFLELAAGVGVCDTVLVLVGPRLGFDRSVVHRGGIRGWCMSYHWRSVHHRGGVHQRRMVHWCVVDGSVVDGTSMVQRGVVKAMVAAAVPLNSVAVLSALLQFLLKHRAFGSIVSHGSPLQIDVGVVKGVVLVTHLIPTMPPLLLLLLAPDEPKGEKRNAGLLMKLEWVKVFFSYQMKFCRTLRENE